jgi:O-antigen/teichoic acid export membrane protein
LVDRTDPRETDRPATKFSASPAQERLVKSRRLKQGRIWIARFAGVLGAALGSAGASFLSQFLLVHHLPLNDCGTIFAALSVANFLQPIANVGAPMFIAQLGNPGDGVDASLWLRSGLPYLAIAGAACCAIAILYWRTAGNGAVFTTNELLMIVPLVLVFPIVELWSSRYQIERRFASFSVLQISVQAPRLVALLAAISIHARLTLRLVLTSYSALASIMCIAGIGGLAAWAMRPATGPRPKGWELPRAGAPYAALAVMSMGLAQLTVALLYTVGSPALAAQVTAAGLLITAVGMVPSVLYAQLLLPLIAEWNRTDRCRHTALLYVGLVGMTFVGAGVALLLICMRDFVTAHLFGPRYAAVGVIIAVWAVALPFRFGSFALSAALLLRSNMNQKLRIHAISAGVFLILLAVLLRPLGAIAPAVSTIVSEIVLLALHMRASQRAVPELNWAMALRPGFLRQQLNLLIAR